MEELREKILATRKIKDNSLNLYLNNIRKLSPNDDLSSLDFLTKTESIMGTIKDYALTTQRGYLTSIIVGLSAFGSKYEDELEFYRLKLANLNEVYNEFINQNQKTDKQKKNWTNLGDLLKINNKLRLEVNNRGIKKKDKISNKDFDLLQKYLISSLYVLQPPVRLDFAGMKIIKSEKEDDNKNNFLVARGKNKKLFIFNDFKTAKSKGKIRQPINTKLNSVLNLWLKHNDSDNFLVGKGGRVMTPNALGKAITRIFDIEGKRITLNLIRHIYISEHINLEQKKKEEKIAEAMHHSNSMQTDYAKTD